MTIEQRQNAAVNWANAKADFDAADEQASHYDRLRIEASLRLERARKDLDLVACVGPNVRTRVFALPATNSRDRELVKVTYQSSIFTAVELLKTEPNE